MFQSRNKMKENLKVIVFFLLSRFCSSADVFTNLLQTATQDFMDMWVTNFTIHEPLSSYDYIIIGSGPAGSVLANRLSEDSNVTVLLLEAGQAEVPMVTDVPMVVPNLQSTTFNYNYTPPAGQKYGCLAMNNHQCFWPHGKGVGGSSIINYMIHTRGNRRDFDAWEKMGNEGWGYKHLKPLFEKIEDLNVKGVEKHSNKGKLSVEDVPFRSTISKAFIEGAQEAGYKYLNYNGDENLGVSYLQQHTKNGWRMTAAKAYLEDVINRPNLHIITNAMATKIIIDKKSMRATGVLYKRNNEIKKVQATLEVILSAGAFESPKLLMLSGIGPKQTLKKFEIEMIKDLPVGEVIYDHTGVLGPIYLINNQSDNLINMDSVSDVGTMIQWSLGYGPLTTNGIESLLYMKTNFSQETDPLYPDIEIMQSVASLEFDKGAGVKRALNIRDEVYKNIFEPIQNRRSFQYVPLLLQQRTKGSLTLKSTDPGEKPVFDYNFLENEDDVNAILEAVYEAIRITDTAPFKPLQPEIYTPKLPECPDADVKTDSDKYWKCYIRHFTTTLHHQTSTTKMGPKSDKTAVVDSRLRVHGFNNLRVVDIGIIPTAPTAHTAALSYVIGEKAAEMIKEDAQTLRRKREITNDGPKKTYYDWQKNPDLSSEESTEIESNEDDPKQNLTLMDIILASTTPAVITTRRHDISTILRPINDGRVTKLEKLDGHHHRHNKRHRVKSHHVMTFADSVNDDGHLNVSHVAAILEQAPAADEDTIKVVQSDNATNYGKGANKPKVITEKLHQTNTTEFDERVNNERNDTNEGFVVISVGKSEKEGFNKTHNVTGNERTKRETLDLETIENLQRALEVAKQAAEQWDRLTRRVRQIRTYMRQMFGFSDDGTSKTTIGRNRRETNSTEELKINELKNKTLEFIDRERHESDKEKEVVFAKVKKNKH